MPVSVVALLAIGQLAEHGDGVAADLHRFEHVDGVDAPMWARAVVLMTLARRDNRTHF
jgi:hypothetical protein